MPCGPYAGGIDVYGTANPHDKKLRIYNLKIWFFWWWIIYICGRYNTTIINGK